MVDNSKFIAHPHVLQGFIYRYTIHKRYSNVLQTYIKQIWSTQLNEQRYIYIQVPTFGYQYLIFQCQPTTTECLYFEHQFYSRAKRAAVNFSLARTLRMYKVFCLVLRVRTEFRIIPMFSRVEYLFTCASLGHYVSA